MGTTTQAPISRRRAHSAGKLANAPLPSDQLSRPEIRLEQLTGMRTILAPGRADRPDNFTSNREPAIAEATCPFCEGREQKTPPELYADRPGGGDPDTSGWLTRAVPNLYPALDGGGEGPGPASETGAFSSSMDPLRASARSSETDLFSSRPAHGFHEVLINTPSHHTSLAELPDDQLTAAVGIWRERMRAHSDAACSQLIVNEGGAAGASLEHTHAQLYALPFVPATVARERERASSYAERTGGGGLLSDVMVEEVRRKERLVAIDDEAALICPWASRAPFELRIIPRRSVARFEDDTAGVAMIRTALTALEKRFGESPLLNLWVRTAPRGAEHFHWHLDIAPRLTTKAGFEFATGVDINVYPPERAAADLRESLAG